MGQYYKFMNVDKKQICEKNRHGWKLMEHSYLGNDYCDDIFYSVHIWSNFKKLCKFTKNYRDSQIFRLRICAFNIIFS